MRDDGIANDLVVAVLPREAEGEGESEVEGRLAEALSGYDPIVYERVWSPRLVERLRRKLPGKVFIGLRGEHVLLDSAPADIFCDGEPRWILAPLVQWLRGESDAPPAQTLFRRQRGGGSPAWDKPAPAVVAPPRTARYAPNLRPVVVNPELLPEVRTFSVVGNDGCPFQLDARDNPLYAGTKIPERYGRGCAFCTTGNHYEGHPNAETAASVLEQIRYLRANAPERRLLVLKDQNPFGYLTEVIERCETEALSGFTLLLETRAEWFLRNARRFDRALDVARRIDVRIAPFLVGIENFSQPELDRFNKGITVATNIEFLDTLWRWKEEYGEALDLGHTAFGFILFSPWTTMQDLETNLAAHPAHALRPAARQHPAVTRPAVPRHRSLLPGGARRSARRRLRLRERERLAALRLLSLPAVEARARRRGALRRARDGAGGAKRQPGHGQPVPGAGRRVRLGRGGLAGGHRRRRVAPLSGARAGGGRPGAPPALAPASEAFRRRFARLVRPLSFDGPFAGGWRFGEVLAAPGRVEVELRHAVEPRLVVELVPRGHGPHFRRSRHYEIRAAERKFTAAQHEALTVLSEAIAENDS